MFSRRALLLGALLIALGAGLALWGSSHTWWSEQTFRTPPLPPQVNDVRGRDEAPWIAPVAFALLAAAGAALALRRVGRGLVGLLALGGGSLLVVAGAAEYFAANDQTLRPHPAWPGLVGLGGLAVVAGAGLLLASLRAPRGAAGGLGARFAPGREARPATEGGDPAQLWDALDRGEDPSVR
jgi:uncharacterized membrane protein (TIGR02234 family)